MRTHGRICRVLVDEGTAQGQMMFWDDVNKRLGVNQSVPTSLLDINGTTTVKRLLAGGVTE